MWLFNIFANPPTLRLEICSSVSRTRFSRVSTPHRHQNQRQQLNYTEKAKYRQSKFFLKSIIVRGHTSYHAKFPTHHRWAGIHAQLPVPRLKSPQDAPHAQFAQQMPAPDFHPRTAGQQKSNIFISTRLVLTHSQINQLPTYTSHRHNFSWHRAIFHTGTYHHS